MNISSRDNAMPVFLLRNCAGHLSGSLRTIGAVAVGQLGRSGLELLLLFGKMGVWLSLLVQPRSLSGHPGRVRVGESALSESWASTSHRSQFTLLYLAGVNELSY